MEFAGFSFGLSGIDGSFGGSWFACAIAAALIGGFAGSTGFALLVSGATGFAAMFGAVAFCDFKSVAFSSEMFFVGSSLGAAGSFGWVTAILICCGSSCN